MQPCPQVAFEALTVLTLEQKESLAHRDALLHERDAELGRQRLALEESELKATADKARQEMFDRELNAFKEAKVGHINFFLILFCFSLLFSRCFHSLSIYPTDSE